MNILITGGTGFIGNALVKSLIDQGHVVTVLSR
ncbi:MAG: NAD-dependent epimerase/dehydratase family protein, partial [Methylobacter sp.]|nr:NAD-dependent epimerase/dehydratase family protein [Methylobacter sp.]